jgi:hypothetical protein
MTRRVALVTAVLALLAMGSGVGQGGAGAVPGAPSSPAAQAPAGPQPGMAEMMKMHEQMMAEMKAADAKLDALVNNMNAAGGEARVAAMAAVVNELARQSKAMHERMGQMHQQMMGGRGMMMRR